MQKHIPRKARELTPGDKVDLEGDPFAFSDDPTPEFEYCVVADLEMETPNCVRVDFENYTSIGFPPDHKVRVLNEAYGA